MTVVTIKTLFFVALFLQLAKNDKLPDVRGSFAILFVRSSGELASAQTQNGRVAFAEARNEDNCCQIEEENESVV